MAGLFRARTLTAGSALPGHQRTFEIEGAVDEEAQELVFGGFLQGAGSVWLDAFELQVREADGSYSTIEIENAGFEDGSVFLLR